MSKLFDSFISKLLVLLVVVLLVIGLGDEIVTNEMAGEAVGALMGELPFAMIITDVAARFLKVSKEVPVYSTSSFLQDIILLAVMAAVEPPLMSLLSSFFLAMPNSYANWRDQEDYMEGFSYRMRETILAIFAAPLIAVFSAWLTTQFLDYLRQQIGDISSLIIGALAFVSVTTVSLIPLVLSGLALGEALSWRLLVTLGRNMIETLVINVLCLTLYVAVVGGSELLFGGSIVAFFIVMLILDYTFQGLMRIIVS